MDLYKLNSKELRQLNKEFGQTAFGKRLKCFCSFPAAGCLLSIIGFNAPVSNIGFSLNFAILGITTLQYFSMLKDYIESKK